LYCWISLLKDSIRGIFVKDAIRKTDPKTSLATKTIPSISDHLALARTI
jgi:hypothetical protein